jgi:excisionase family DNA binding protein
MDTTLDKLTIGQASLVLGVSRNKVARLVHAGALPASPSLLDYRRKLIPRDAVDELAARESPPVNSKLEGRRHPADG